MKRREAIRLMLAGAAGSAVIPGMGIIERAAAGPAKVTGRLSIFNAHTDETLAVRYLDAQGCYAPDGLSQLNRIFRCHHNGAVYPIEPELFSLLDALSVRLGAAGRTFELISGYRSPEYNQLLRAKSGGVASNSYHLRGMAADLRLPGVSVATLRGAAQKLRAGGVGRYPDFVHVDIGPVRYW